MICLIIEDRFTLQILALILVSVTAVSSFPKGKAFSSYGHYDHPHDFYDIFNFGSGFKSGMYRKSCIYDNILTEMY